MTSSRLGLGEAVMYGLHRELLGSAMDRCALRRHMRRVREEGRTAFAA